MKIKNDLVSIKLGNKHYDFNNLILDEYLKRFAKAQLDKEKLDSIITNKELKYCLIKFDTEFSDLKNDTELHNQDFDICLLNSAKATQEISQNKITMQYHYAGQRVWDYSKQAEMGIGNYKCKKITALGFNSSWASDAVFEYKFPVCAVLDTSNYNIYIQDNQEINVSREDTITTDTLFYSNSVKGPAHLAPRGLPQIINQENIYNSDKTAWQSFNDNAYGILYSVGLSSYHNYIDKEFVIGEDIQLEQSGAELIIKGLENYLSTENLIYPSNNIHPSSNLYPIRSNYKYIILKYKIWQMVHSGTYDNVVATSTDTKCYYYQAFSIDKFGKANFKIKYERG